MTHGKCFLAFGQFASHDPRGLHSVSDFTALTLQRAPISGGARSAKENTTNDAGIENCWDVDAHIAAQCIGLADMGRKKQRPYVAFELK